MSDFNTDGGASTRERYAKLLWFKPLYFNKLSDGAAGKSWAMAAGIEIANNGTDF